MPTSRIVILGTSGSGKTTLAKALAAKKDISRIELDVLFWNPGWIETPQPEFHNKIRETIAATESWVLCGNYNAAKQISLPLATDIIWLNYPLYINFWRGLKRTTQQFISGEDIFPGCKQTLRLSFFSKNSILLWILKTHKVRKADFAKLLIGENFPAARIWIVQTKKDYKQLLQSI